jgi:sugar/nucleoside kinase (ribokinase family)
LAPKRKDLDVIVAGDSAADLLLSGVPPLEDGKEKWISGANLVLGGSSSITAYNLAKLGARVGFASVLGDDVVGHFVRSRLASAGLNLEELRHVRTPGSGLTVWCSRGEWGAARAGITYAGTIAELRARHIRSAYLSRAAHLHVGAYFLLTALHAEAPALFRRARRLGLTTSLDCNWDPSEKWDSNIRGVLAHTDLFFPNEAEALRLTGRRSVRAAAEDLGRLARVVAVKQGDRGVFLQSPLGWLEIPARKVKAIDTTGAGDSFNAGFLEAYVRGEDLETCARAGLAAGTRAVTKIGGTTAFE